MEGDLIESESQALDAGIEPITEILEERCEPCHSKDLLVPVGLTPEDIKPEAAGAPKPSAEKRKKKKNWDVPLRHNLPRRAKNRAIVLITGVLHGVKLKRDLGIPRKLIMRKIEKSMFPKDLVRAKKIQKRRARIPESSDSSYSSYS